jgi:predicted DNA-binding transcriptional regulator AlpA
MEHHIVASDLMAGASVSQRDTMVLIGVDPLMIDVGEELTGIQENVVALVEELGGLIGLSRTEIWRFAQEREIGSRSAIYKAVKDLDGGRLVKIGTKRDPKFAVPASVDSDPPPATPR